MADVAFPLRPDAEAPLPPADLPPAPTAAPLPPPPVLPPAPTPTLNSTAAAPVAPPPPAVVEPPSVSAAGSSSAGPSLAPAPPTPRPFNLPVFLMAAAASVVVFGLIVLTAFAVRRRIRRGSASSARLERKLSSSSSSTPMIPRPRADSSTSGKPASSLNVDTSARLPSYYYDSAGSMASPRSPKFPGTSMAPAGLAAPARVARSPPSNSSEYLLDSFGKKGHDDRPVSHAPSIMFASKGVPSVIYAKNGVPSVLFSSKNAPPVPSLPPTKPPPLPSKPPASPTTGKSMTSNLFAQPLTRQPSARRVDASGGGALLHSHSQHSVADMSTSSWALGPNGDFR